MGYARLKLISGETEAKPVGQALLWSKEQTISRRNTACGADEASTLDCSGISARTGPSTRSGRSRPSPPRSRKKRIEFARLIHEADDDEFEARYTDYLDVDQFLKFIACNVIVCNLDSLSGSKPLYLSRAGVEPVSVSPWDMDHSFGAFHLMGTPDTRRNMSIDKPVTDHRPIIARVLGVPATEKPRLHRGVWSQSSTATPCLRRSICLRTLANGIVER